MLILEVDVLGHCLLSEEFVALVDESHHICFAHVHHHLSLVDFAEVHHLVDEVEDTLRVFPDNLVDALSVRLLVFLDEGEQRGDDEGKRRADFMTDVHEELDLCLAHLFGVDVLLQDELVFHLALAVAQVEHQQSDEDEQIDEFRPDAGIPGRMHDDGEFLDRCFVSIADCLDAEIVVAGRKMGECQLVLSKRSRAPFLAVDAVGIGNLLHIIIGKCGELDGKRVVLVREIEFPAVYYPIFCDGIEA